MVKVRDRETVTTNGEEKVDQLQESLTTQEAPSGKVIFLKPLLETHLEIPIIGVSPLIPHKWSEKSLQMMRDKQFGVPTSSARPPKNPEEEAHQSCYWIKQGQPGMPATAFKAAIVGAARFFDNISMVESKQIFYVVGQGMDQLVPIEGEYEQFEATPRNQTGVPDLRYRMRIFPWRANLQVRFVASRITQESVYAMVDAAGRGGVGDWRPSAPKSLTGSFGTWRVDQGALGTEHREFSA